MKKLIIYGMIAFLSSAMIPAPLQAATSPGKITSTTPVENREAQVLLSRLEAIKAMDKTGLSTSERKDLRKEVRSIKKELKAMNQGVYLSVGAIIIIVLLLILLV